MTARVERKKRRASELADLSDKRSHVRIGKRTLCARVPIRSSAYNTYFLNNIERVTCDRCRLLAAVISANKIHMHPNRETFMRLDRALRGATK